MDNRKQALYQTMLARISLGAVPMDGLYWFDPRSRPESTSAKRPEAQAAKVAPFAAGSEAGVRKSAEGDFFPSTIEAAKAAKAAQAAKKAGAQHERNSNRQDSTSVRDDRTAGEGTGKLAVPPTCC